MYGNNKPRFGKNRFSNILVFDEDSFKNNLDGSDDWISIANYEENLKLYTVEKDKYVWEVIYTYRSKGYSSKKKNNGV